MKGIPSLLSMVGLSGCFMAGAVLSASAAAASLNYIMDERELRVTAGADEALDNDAAAPATPYEPLDRTITAMAAGEDGSADATASQDSTLHPTEVRATGSVSSFATTSSVASGLAASEFRVQFAWNEGVERAYTLTGSVSSFDSNGQVGTVSFSGNAGEPGRNVTVSNGTEAFEFAGVLLPGRTYWLTAAVGSNASPSGPFGGSDTSMGAFDFVFSLSESALTGDYNASGQVEQGDLDLVLLNWGLDTDANDVPTGWTNDRPEGQIEQTELDKVLLNWGATSAPDFRGVGVPEPAAMSVAIWAWMLGLRRRSGRTLGGMSSTRGTSSAGRSTTRPGERR